MQTSSKPSFAYVSRAELIALQRPARDLDLFAKRPARAQMSGESRSRFRGRGMEFEEARVYAPGDDVRTIDWRVTARTGTTHTKVFREERERPVHILVDQRSSMFFGSNERFKSVLAAQLAGLIAWSALQSSDRIGGQVVGDKGETDIRARRSHQAVLRLIHELADYNQQLPGEVDNAISTADLLLETQRLVKPGTALFIISDFLDFDEACQRTLTLISRHADITLIRVQDVLERELPAMGRTRLGDGKNSAQISLAEGLLRKLKLQQTQLDSQLQRAALMARARLIDVSCEDQAMNIMRRHFGK